MNQSFKPIVNKNCKIMILGSFPGEASLRKQQYYGHSRNQFWKIIYQLFDQKVDVDYNQRIQFLLDHKIALWDVIDQCERQGSLDSNIKNICINDFEGLFEVFPNIQTLFFNGAKSEEVFKRKVQKNLSTQRDSLRLPSTSPAHAIPFEKKLEQWTIIKQYLD